MAEQLTPKQKSAIARAVQNPDLRPILFRKAVGVQWFDAFNEAGFLIPSEIPPPAPAKDEGYVNIPVWPITEYLVATSEQFLDPANEKYATECLAFIRTATKHAKEHAFGNYRVWWQFSKIIQNVPPHLISMDDLPLVDFWLDDKYERGMVAENLGEHWLVNLLDQKDQHCNKLSLCLLEILYKVSLIDKRYGNSDRKEAMLRFDSWHAKKLTKTVAPKAGQALGRSAVEVFQKGLEYVLQSLDNDNWSSIWRRAIEDHEQNYSAEDADDVLIEGFRDSLLAYVEGAPEAAKAYVGSLLESPFQTTRRIAIYAVDQRFQQLRELIGLVLVQQHLTSNSRHEFWRFLHHHYPTFGVPEKALVKNLIGRLLEQEESGHAIEGAAAYERAIWLKAIKDYGVDENQRYQECINVIGGEPEHPDFSSYMTSGWVDHKSPISQDELSAMEVEELIKWLDSYKATGRGEPGLEGLVKTLKQAIKAQPLRYFNQLHKLACLNLAYVHEILEAYGELWTEKAQLPWDDIWAALLSFCNEVIHPEGFWLPENAVAGRSFVGNRHWVVSSIGRLIENGTRSDEHAFPEKYLEQAQAILLFLLEKQAGEEFKPDSDAVFVSINSPRGHCIEALINLSLRSCRLANKHSGSHVSVWKKFEPIYDELLIQGDNGQYEFATLVVNFLPNFLYMSKEWVLGNLNKIFDQGNYQKWLCAMNGYAYVGGVYESIYGFLKANGHFLRALDDVNIKDRVDEKIVQNIAVAYINGFEELDDKTSLIYQLLERRQHPELSQLIWFLWTLRKDEDTKVRDKIFALWPRLFEVIDTSTREGQKLASKLGTWSVFVDELNDTTKALVLAVAPFAGENFNSHELLELFARTSKTYPSATYEIWLSLLEKASPDYPEEAVRTALANFVQGGAEGVRRAKEIVSAYLKGGNERPRGWLKEIMDTTQSV